MTGYTIIWSA